MKELTEAEFKDRTLAILRARKIFMDSGITKDLSLAFELYQKVVAEREREIFISTQSYLLKPRSYMDEYEKPKCPDCGSQMGFRKVPKNDSGIQSQWVCLSKECDTVLDSENDINWWMDKLSIKEKE